MSDDTVAALDLGSNSFHLVIAEVVNGQPKILDRIKETTRLAKGFDEQGNIKPECVETALAALERIAQRIAPVPAGKFRAVGTNAIRSAKNGRAFLKQAQVALKHPIEIVSGREEARLIYSGVAHSVSNVAEKRLVIDIGGGSTEFIIGQGYVPEAAESLEMGCVRYGEQFFSGGKINKKRWKAALTDAELQLQPVKQLFAEDQWEQAIGSSGSALAIADVCHGMGNPSGVITVEALTLMRDHLLDVGCCDQINLPGLSESRKLVFPGGLAILTAAFYMLNIREMAVSDGALREGVLYDLIGRLNHDDVRYQSARDLAASFNVDLKQAQRVAKTAKAFYRQVKECWDIDDEESKNILLWACQLHELGLSVSHSKYQRHGAYLLEHADIPGFARDTQKILSIMVGAHRRKLSLSGVLDCSKSVQYLVVILRIAVLLHRDRSDVVLPEIKIVPKTDGCAMIFPKGWLAKRPLTMADLEQELKYLRPLGVEISWA